MESIHNNRIYRGQHRAVGGVMSGLAEYFGGDPLLWRLGAILFALLTAVLPVVVVYGLAWWLLPERPGVQYRVVE